MSNRISTKSLRCLFLINRQPSNYKHSHTNTDPSINVPSGIGKSAHKCHCGMLPTVTCVSEWLLKCVSLHLSFFLVVIIHLQTWNKLFSLYWATFYTCTLRHGGTFIHIFRQTHAHEHISICDYAWHVQSGIGDVINLFQQETDAWMSHTKTHTHVCCQGNKANVTVSQKQSPESAAWHSVIIPSRIFTFKA